MTNDYNISYRCSNMHSNPAGDLLPTLELIGGESRLCPQNASTNASTNPSTPQHDQFIRSFRSNSTWAVCGPIGPFVPKSPWRGTEEGTNRVEVRCVRHASELVIPSMANLETKRNQA